MDKILEGISPHELIKHTSIYKKLDKSKALYYKNTKFIEYLIIEQNDKQKIIEKKLIEYNRYHKSYKVNIVELLFYYTNEYLMDLWYYLNPESYELYLNDNDTYMNIITTTLHNKKVNNFLYLMERHNVSFWRGIFWKGISVNDYIKIDKETTKKIILYENIRDNIVSERKDKEYFFKAIKNVKDMEILNIFIEQLKDSNYFLDIKEIIFKTGLINNHKQVINYFLSSEEKFPISMIKYVINPDYLDNYNEDYYCYDQEILEYKNKYKNTSFNKSQNLKKIYDKLCENYDKEEIINYILNTHCSTMNENLIASVVRFHCKFILQDILMIKGKTIFKRIFDDTVMEDLVRYGKNDVLDYIISVSDKEHFKRIVNYRDLLSPSLYNPDDRVTKTITNYEDRDRANNICYGFLSSSKISDKTKIQKLKILFKKFGKEPGKHIFRPLTSTDNFKVTFWVFSKFYDNKIKKNIPNIENTIKEIILSQKMNLFERLLNVLDSDFNYWIIFKSVICSYTQIKHRDKILNMISYKLHNIKDDIEEQKNILDSLECFTYKISDNEKIHEFCACFDKLLKILKQSGVNLNLNYKKIFYNGTTILSCIRNIELFKVAILNGISYPAFFKNNYDTYSNYKIFDAEKRPWLKLYKLIRRLEIRKSIKYKKEHRYKFYDTNVCIQNRPPNSNVPVLKKGGEQFYVSQRNMFSDMCWEEDYVNPNHIDPLKLLELAKKEILVTPKVDGITSKNIDMANLYPPIPDHLENCVFDGEYYEDLDMYFIFGLRNKENNLNCPYDDFLELRNEHLYTKYGVNDFTINSKDLDKNEKIINKELESISNFYEKNKGKTLWWPKAFWKIFDKDIILDVLSNLQKIEKQMENLNNEQHIKTDGYVINIPFNKTEIYKLKPSNHMTIDLNYDGNWKDKNNNNYTISNQENIKHGIYRCYYEYGSWVARDFRPEKKIPNNKEIVDAVQNYHKKPWTVEEIKKYSKPAYYQNFHNNPHLRAFTKLRNLWYNRTIHDYMNILDIGCGYLNSSLWKNKYKKIDGIDSDLAIKERFKEVDQNDKRVFVQDFTEKWDFKDDYIKNQINENLGNKIYDVILMNFSLHYAFNSPYGFDNLMNEIDIRSVNRNTKFMVSFIDCDLLFKDKDKIDFEDGGFLKLKNKLDFNKINEITYYYPWRSQKVNTEKIFSQSFIEDKLLRYGWYIKEENEADYYIHTPGYSELSKSIKRITFTKNIIL